MQEQLIAVENGHIHVKYIDQKYVTWSDKIGLIAYFKASRNDGFKYSACWNLPLVVATCTNFSHILYIFLTFKTIYCTSNKQQNFLPF